MENWQLPGQLCWATELHDKVARLCCVSDMGLRVSLSPSSYDVCKLQREVEGEATRGDVEKVESVGGETSGWRRIEENSLTNQRSVGQWPGTFTTVLSLGVFDRVALRCRPCRLTLYVVSWLSFLHSVCVFVIKLECDRRLWSYAVFSVSETRSREVLLAGAFMLSTQICFYFIRVAKTFCFDWWRWRASLSSHTAVQAWQPCPLWEPSRSHPILV